jgi:proteasome assembly chaperone (PAC2) family protein
MQDRSSPLPLQQPTELYSEFVKVRLKIAERDLIHEFSKEIYQEESEKEQRDCEIYGDQLSNVSVLGRFDAISSLTLLIGYFTERANQLKAIISSPSPVDGIFSFIYFQRNLFRSYTSTFTGFS